MTAPNPDGRITSADGRHHVLVKVVAIPDGYHAMVIAYVEIYDTADALVATWQIPDDIEPVRFLDESRLLVRSVTGAGHVIDIGTGVSQFLIPKEVAKLLDESGPTAPGPAAAPSPGPSKPDEAIWRRGARPGSERWFYLPLIVLSIAMASFGVAANLEMVPGVMPSEALPLTVMGILLTALFTVVFSLTNETIVDPQTRLVTQEVRSALHRWRREHRFEQFAGLLVKRNRMHGRLFHLVELLGPGNRRVVLFGAPTHEEAWGFAQTMAANMGLSAQSDTP